MAERAEVHYWHLALETPGTGQALKLDFTVARHPSETVEHLLARVLAYVLNYQPGLEFSKGVCEGGRPAIFLQQNGHFLLWVEVGQPSAQRLGKALRLSDTVVVYAFGNGLAQWRKRQLHRVVGSVPLRVYEFDNDWLKRLVPHLARRTSGRLVVDHDHVQLVLDGRGYATRLVPLYGV